ncbi:hypothetical protein ACOTEH_23755 [Achromobacter xylosoxidans]
MTDKAEFERLLDVYGFRCERFGQDLSTHARAQVVAAFAALASAPVAGEPFMYGIMGPDGKAHLDEFCVSADPAELEQEVVAHMNEDHKGGKYSVVALFTNAAPQASATAFAKLQSAYVAACDQIGDLLAEKQASAEPVRIVFPARLRKMWSGGEVQAWLDQHQGITPPPATAKGSLERYRKWKAQQDQATAPCTCPSGDGSLRHPCPAHPQGKPPAPSQPTDKEQA